MIHTVQFTQDGNNVQYPDLDLVDRISSTSEMAITGEGIISMGGEQALTVDVAHLEGDALLTINGDGNSHANLEYSEITETGTRVCDAVMNFNSAITDVQLWASQAGGVDSGCPIGGLVSYQGAANISCTDESGSYSASGSWTVHQSFEEDGTMSIRVISGGNVWELEETCL